MPRLQLLPGGGLTLKVDIEVVAVEPDPNDKYRRKYTCAFYLPHDVQLDAVPGTFIRNVPLPPGAIKYVEKKLRKVLQQ